MSESNKREITQADCDEYNRHMPAHFQAELCELEWRLVYLITYPIAQRKPAELKLCDKNYWKKSEKWHIDVVRGMRHSGPPYSKENNAESPQEPPRDPNARYDENGYRITSDAERDAFFNQVGTTRE